MTADDRNILRDVADALEAGNASPLERASLANAVRLIVAIDQAAQSRAMDARREALEEAHAIALGCKDYSAGLSGEDRENYHHGMQTVANVLRSVIDKGHTMQSRVVLGVGRDAAGGNP